MQRHSRAGNPHVQAAIMSSARDTLSEARYPLLFRALLALNAENIILDFNNLMGKLPPRVPPQPPRFLHHLNVSSCTISSELI
jgi:hypothetical protein